MTNNLKEQWTKTLTKWESNNRRTHFFKFKRAMNQDFHQMRLNKRRTHFFNFETVAYTVYNFEFKWIISFLKTYFECKSLKSNCKYKGLIPSSVSCVFDPFRPLSVAWRSAPLWSPSWKQRPVLLPLHWGPCFVWARLGWRVGWSGQPAEKLL